MFEISDTEGQKISEWLKEHDKTCAYGNPNNTGAIGGRLTFMFTGTSLGQIVKVQCACGETHDATDYDLW